MPENVIPIQPIKPKTLRRQYKSRTIIVTYMMQERKWAWTVESTTTTRYTDYAPTEVKAFRAAEKFIDSLP